VSNIIKWTYELHKRSKIAFYQAKYQFGIMSLTQFSACVDSEKILSRNIYESNGSDFAWNEWIKPTLTLTDWNLKFKT